MYDEDRVEAAGKTVISGEFDNLRKEIAILQESVSQLNHMLHPVLGPPRDANKEDARQSEPSREKSNFAQGLEELATQVLQCRREVQSVISRIEI